MCIALCVLFLASADGAFLCQPGCRCDLREIQRTFFSLGDEKRGAIGIPCIDKHLYARENGWMINALARLYAVTGYASTLAEVESSARRVATHHSIAGGGFSPRIRLPI
jgi:uncharacterized protein